MNLMGLPLANGSEKVPQDFLEVLGTLVHKLSQPLTSLRGSVEVALMEKIEEPEFRQVLERSLEESHRMTEIIKMLRDVLEMEASGEDVQPVPWRQSVEKFLKEAALVDGNCRLQLVCDVADEVWVKASPQHLDTATRRLIGRVIKAARRNHVVRIRLSVRGEAACLSICAESSLPETLEPGDVDGWIVHRAIERQGGWLTISGVSEAGRCYELYLPLAPSAVTGKPRTP